MTFGGRYKPTETKHAGGMGSVYVCHDPNLDREVAIKFLQPGTDRRRIFDEIEALQRIRSKNVVEIYDLVIHGPDNQVGVVQEFLPGRDLVEFSRTPQRGGDYLKLLYQIASGVTDIHAQNVIHRDLKPNNMKFDEEGLVNIFDFDLARDPDDAHTLGFRGTPGFAAPELFNSGAVHFTSAVDVWAFCATALFCAMGDLPPEFTRKTGPEADEWIQRGGFSSIGTDTPQQVVDLLHAGLSRDPTARPRGAEIRDLLAKHLLRDRHRALLVYNNAPTWCDTTKPSVRLEWPTVGSLLIEYDGFDFIVREANGEVWINNQDPAPGRPVPGSCVVTLGHAARANSRKFITLDVSHPEVVL